MQRFFSFCSVVLIAVSTGGAPAARTYVLKSAEGLELRNLTAEGVPYNGRRAVKLLETPAPAPAAAGAPDRDAIAILPDLQFENGVIEVELAGRPRAQASDTARGFVGIAFRVSDDASRYECFYIRPTNGRANDQLRRNRSTQYFSHPEYPWHRLRREHPGVYESYVDLVPGAWTKLRVEVSGTTARLYVNGAMQPSLIVNDLKLGVQSGRIALWVGDQTEAYFSKVVVRPGEVRAAGER